MSRLPTSWLIELTKRMRRLPVTIGRPERLCVYLGGRWLAVCLVKGGFRPVVRIKAILPSATPGRDGNHTVAATLTALTEWLRVHPLRGSIEWVVGIDYVRYLLLPWDERLANRSFCHALAAALFAQQCSGDDAPFSAFQLRLAPLLFGQPRVAALIPVEIVNELTEFALRHRCRTRRITPTLGVVWNRFFSLMKNEAGVLALVEGPRLMRVGYDHGHVTSLSVEPFSGERTARIQQSVTRFFPARDMTAPASGELALSCLVPEDDVRFAYALCGVF
ncbi:MAG: hypothetical protein EPN73_00985 [Paraburkholderia sp.]|uniref:hypothetical protein n=1 Tax=Paraburkholderia sp. TaxID=1926495 RepID=UPI0012104A93|nr:hypothetical protein [Paraburkholderia sp.]TAL99155.1 MAG: hypothetical protein EPN73_00985 [Paraburkholderia sp.]